MVNLDYYIELNYLTPGWAKSRESLFAYLDDKLSCNFMNTQKSTVRPSSGDAVAVGGWSYCLLWDWWGVLYDGVTTHLQTLFAIGAVPECLF